MVEGSPRGKTATRKDWAHALVLPEWTVWILEKRKEKEIRNKPTVVDWGLEALEASWSYNTCHDC
jgi:hypothetical protein